MTKGLVRSNNLSDVPDKKQAVINLGLALEDYAALKGLYTTASLDFAVVGGIAGSEGNYQAQIDAISGSIAGVVLSGFVNRQGNGAISGNWTNTGGYFSVASGLPSGFSPSSDSHFVLSIENGEAVISASGITASGFSFSSWRQSATTVSQQAISTGVSELRLIPVEINGTIYYMEGQEMPSFWIKPATLESLIDLITGQNSALF